MLTLLSSGSECQGTAVEALVPAWCTACLRSQEGEAVLERYTTVTA